jgi:hypothetical protein
MTLLISTILASLPNIFLAILSKVVTQSFLQQVIEKVLLATMAKAVTMTTNTVDDELFETVKTALQTKGN